MKVLFYKTVGDGFRDGELLATRNIETLPRKHDLVEYNGQRFRVLRVVFDLTDTLYKIFLIRW